MIIEHRDASSILTVTGGFLKGFTHSFSPSIGCAFGRGACGEYCYAKRLQSHLSYGLGEWGDYLLVKRNAADLLEKEFLKASRRDPGHRHHIAKLKIFASPATEPLLQQTLEIYRRCLEIVRRHPIQKWVIQTRSPLILRLKDEVEALGNRCCVNFTLETDSDAVFRAIASGASPLPSQRMAVIEELRAWNTTLSIAVSPLLPLESPNLFATTLADAADYVLVDTFTAGDGSGGRRTQGTRIPQLFEKNGWGDWRCERAARELFELLRVKIGDHVEWSQAGFLRLAEI